MAGKMPSMVTGANAKIKIGGKTFAYCSDVSYNVSIDTIPVETMGRYEPVTNEPVNYSVSGSLSVVRYTSLASQQNIPGAASTGNGLGAVNYTTGGNAADEINPGNILLSTTWDLAVYQKTQSGPTAGGGTAQVTDAVQFITLTDCRFNRKSASLNKRGILVDSLSFVAILASDDSFTASHSGDTDLS